MNVFDRCKRVIGIKKVILADCDHETYIRDEIHAFGESRILKVPVEDGSTPYCHVCLTNMTIRCAWCGNPIFIGDPITLYTPKEGVEMPEYAVKYKDNPLQFVGCLRRNCADTGGDRAGFWYPPGEVKRVMSPIEQIMAGKKDTVVVNNLADQAEAMRNTSEAMQDDNNNDE